MNTITPDQLRTYVGNDIERWKILEGANVYHQKFGDGHINSVTITKDIEFAVSFTGEDKIRRFMMTSIDKFEKIALSEKNYALFQKEPAQHNLENNWHRLDETLCDLAYIKIRYPSSNILYSINSSRILYNEYQFIPATKFLATSNHRLLIADEVGLGKTIEAGIIYRELQARVGLEKVLIVCPSSLCQKWHDELKARFDEEFTHYKKSADLIAQLRKTNSSDTLFRGIVSLGLIRQKEIAEEITNFVFDLVIIDEAHHCRNEATLNHTIADILSDNSEALLLLTATPMQTQERDLFNLLSILEPKEFDNYHAFKRRIEPNEFINKSARYLSKGETENALKELCRVENTNSFNRFRNNPIYDQVKQILKKGNLTQSEIITLQCRLLELNTLSALFTRKRKREVLIDNPEREPETLLINFSHQERKAYENILNEVKTEYREKHERGGIGWLSVIKERQAASCLPAFLQKKNEESAETTVLLDEFSIESEIDKDPRKQNLFGNPRCIYHPKTNNPIISQTIPDTDSKFKVFLEKINELFKKDSSKKVLVFSTYRHTIDYLKEQLDNRNIQTAIIHGGIDVGKRSEIIKSFKEDKNIRILISSEVGSEGLDFQFCDTLFNYDLPWNPMRVEQRIGRIDRFGQKSKKVKIYNLVINNSIESRIFSKLYDRIKIFKETIGDIEPILGEVISDLVDYYYKGDTEADEQEKIANKAAIKILEEKKKFEEFEKLISEFSGQDEIFSSFLNTTNESGLSISEREVLSLVDQYLKKFEHSRLEKVQEENKETNYILHVERDLTDDITRPIKQKSPASNQFLKVIHQAGTQLPITFTRDEAYEGRYAEFIVPTHPLVQAACEHWEQKKFGSLIYFGLQTKENFVGGEFFVFIYSIVLSGIEKQSAIVSIVISKDNEYQPDLSKDLFRLIQTNAIDIPLKEIDQDQFLQAEKKAESIIRNEENIRKTKFCNKNQNIKNSRLLAIDETYKIKRSNIEDLRNLVRNNSPLIFQLRQGQLKNLKKRYEAKKEEIENTPEPSAKVTLLLKGVVTVVNNQ